MTKLTFITKSNPPTQTSGKIQLNEYDPKHEDPHQEPLRSGTSIKNWEAPDNQDPDQALDQG